jgi:hypothetical protein
VVVACVRCSGAGGGRRWPAGPAERLRHSGERGGGGRPVEKKKNGPRLGRKIG